MSDREFERAVTDWLDDGTDRTPARAIDGVLLAVKTTPQERDLWIPWRLPRMLALPRASGIAAVAIVAVVGAGGLILLSDRAPSGAGGPPAPPAATTSPTVTPSPEPSDVAQGIKAWTPYTSALYGFTISYPEGWEVWPATREAKPGGGDELENNDVFFSPEDNLGIGVRLRPAGERADLASVDGLKAWAQAYCTETGALDCPTFIDRTEPMCLDAGGDPCRAAILVRSDGTDPAESGEMAFFPYWPSETFTGAPDRVAVVSVGRGDTFPGAARYGGAVALLKSFLSQMGVTSTAQP